MRVLVAVVVLAGLCSGATAVYRSSLFEIRHVDVVGTRHLDADVVRAAAAVPQGATLLRFPRTAIVERITRDPWVADVRVTRDFPHTLRIRIEERVAFARVDSGQTIWLVDASGFVIGEDSVEASSTLPVVRDVPGLDLKRGRRSTSEVLHNALLLLAGISHDLYQQVRAVSAPSIDETTLVTTTNVEVLMGEAVEVSKKDAVVKQIMREQAESVVFIDVRNPERPIARGLAK